MAIKAVIRKKVKVIVEILQKLDVVMVLSVNNSVCTI